MDIRLRIESLCSHDLWNIASRKPKILKPCFSKRPPPQQIGDICNNNSEGNILQKGKKKTLFSEFLPDKYVSWNPTRSEFPLSEEVDLQRKNREVNSHVMDQSEVSL
ncbi:hypothetical protein Pfo_029370 [Paulownia fortunei]|nr:hypothetical protein Pfo_029370 [Paulownia fortunei]